MASATAGELVLHGGFGGESRGALDERRVDVTAHERHAARLERPGVDLSGGGGEESVKAFHHGGGVDVGPKLERTGLHACRTHRRLAQVARHAPHPAVLEDVKEGFHLGGSRPEHEGVVFVKERVHIHGVVPGDLREDVVVQVLVDPAFGFGLGEGPEDEILLGLVVRTDGAGADAGRIRNLGAAAGNLVDVVPQPDLVAEFLVPFADAFLVGGEHRRRAPAPGTLPRHHHVDVVGEVELRRAGVREVGHHREVSLQTIVLEPLRRIGDLAPDEIGGVVLFAVLVGGGAFFAHAAAGAVMRHHVQILACAGVAPPGVSVAVERRNLPHRGRLAGEVALGVLVDLLPDGALAELVDAAGGALVAGVGGRAALAVRIELAVFRVVGEALGDEELVLPVAAGDVLRLAAQTVEVEALELAFGEAAEHFRRYLAVLIAVAPHREVGLLGDVGLGNL